MKATAWIHLFGLDLRDLKATIASLSAKYSYPKLSSVNNNSDSKVEMTFDQVVADDELFKIWQRFVEGKNDLDQSDILRLAHDHRVVFDPRYSAILIAKKIPISRLVFRLLTYCAVNAGGSGPLRFERLKHLSQLNLSPFALRNFQEIELYIRSSDFSKHVADKIAEMPDNPVAERISNLLRMPVVKGPYASRVALELIIRDASVKGWFAESTFKQTFSARIADLENDDLLNLIDFLIESALLMPPAANVQYLRSLIWERLGIDDPRKNNPASNGFELSSLARGRLSEWLNIIDLEFFFDKVVSDDQGRRAFWQRYIKSIRRVRIALCNIDFTAIPSEDRKRFLSIIARIEPDSYKSSAVIMQFDGFAVVEFGQKYHSCYVFDSVEFQPLVNKWLQSNFIRADQLKMSEALRWTHSGDWHRIYQERLRAYGVRPE